MRAPSNLTRSESAPKTPGTGGTGVSGLAVCISTLAGFALAGCLQGTPPASGNPQENNKDSTLAPVKPTIETWNRIQPNSYVITEKTIADNPQLSIFLNGNIHAGDTYATIYERVQENIQTLNDIVHSDDIFVRNLRTEMQYRLDNGIIPASPRMIDALLQMDYRKIIVEELTKAFQELTPTTISALNISIGNYHIKASGAWSSEKWDQWNIDIAHEHEQLGYTLNDVYNYIQQEEGMTHKPSQKQNHQLGTQI